MNYIEQINWFWLLDAEHSFNGNETRLYFFLLKQSNSLYWKNPLANADGHTASMVGISVNTLKTCRNRIQQAGLIKFRSGGKGGVRDKTEYEIMKPGIRKRSDGYQKLTPDPIPSPAPSPIPSLQKTDDNYKHKQEEEENKKGGGACAPTLPISSEEQMATLEQRRKRFWRRVQPFAAEYGPEVVNSFFNHWAEPNRTGTLMRWELQQTWHTQSRLETWRRKEAKFDKQQANDQEPSIDDYLRERKKQEERTLALLKKYRS